MNRIVGILGIGGALILISWVTSPAARTAPPGRTLSAADVVLADQTAQAVAPLTTQIDDQAARLRARLAQPPAPPKPERNPFTFAGVGRPDLEGRRLRPTSKPVGPTTGIESPVSSPPLALPSLVAITSDAGDGGLMRTAVLSMNDEIKIVKPGQMFDRFIVEAIGPDSVRIVDITSPTRATFIVAIR
jgi:hypothetical protein